MTLLATLVLLGVLITVHELGHFVVAKLTGVRVLTFSLGFGPKLFGFTRGDTEYRISMLPLGGYVRMYGDDVTVDVPAAERHYAFLEKPFLVKSAIAVAGPAANLLLPLGLFFALNVGTEQLVDAVAGTVLPGDPAAAAGVLPGDRILAVDGEPVAVFDDLIEKIGSRAGKTTRLTVDRGGDGKPNHVELTMTPSSVKSQNPAATAPVGRIGLLASIERPIISVDVDSPAALAGLQTGDRVVSVDGVAVRTRADLQAALGASDPTRDLVVVVERTTAAPAGAADGDKKAATPALTITVPGTPAAAPVVVDVGDGTVVPMLLPPPAPVVVGDLRFAVLSDELTGPVLTLREQTAGHVAAAVVRQERDRGIASFEATIGDVQANTPAAARGLTAFVPPTPAVGASGETAAVAARPAVAGHRVVAVDGAAVRIASDLAVALQKDPEAIHVIGVVDGKGEGATFTLRLQKSERRLDGGARILGVSLTSTLGDAPIITREVSAPEAFGRAIGQTGETIKNVAAGYLLLFTGGVSLDQLGGPVLIGTIAGEAARSGPEAYILLMCMISVNLALLNLLPVPVLDGGHLLLFTVEAVRRKKLSATARMRATQVGLLLVGALMVIAVFNDITSLF
ncbi:MAG: RIP metalloprotease RseP [Deltaproteobacteria bacterium]|nr:RIP metalloprotease RseP [Deltaproteobacteria bacterium]